MKIQKFITTGVVAASALMLTSSVQAAIPNLTFDNFASSAGIGNWYGYDSPAYVSGKADPYNGNAGSAYFTYQFQGALNPTCGGNLSTCFIGYNGGNPWYANPTVDFSQYQSIQFDVLWDTTSTLTIDQFNTGTNWPASYLPTWAPQNYIASSDLAGGIEFLLASGANSDVDLSSINPTRIPLNANTGWRTVTVPIPSVFYPDISAVEAIIFKGWSGVSWAPCQAATEPLVVSASFWIDNIVLVGGAVPPLPSMTPLFPAVPGLNLMNLTTGNQFYDRNWVVANTESGLSWAGASNNSFTPTYPVTYSFEINYFPAGPANYNGPIGDLILIANPASAPNAYSDWNGSNVLWMQVQSTSNGSWTTMSYKTNLGGANGNENVSFTVVGSTNTNGVISANILGNYALVFTDANDGYITVPDGTTGTFSLDPTLSPQFMEGTGSNPFEIFFLSQANTASAMNQPIVICKMAISGVPGGFSENFVGESAMVNVTNSAAPSPSSIFIVPTTVVYWVDWTVPAAGFVLENAPSLNGPWQNTTTYTPHPGYGEYLQLIDRADLVSPTKDQYFRIVKHIYTNILVALPGQTFVNGTGVTGTPTPIINASCPAILGPETATAYAVDANNVLCTGINGDNVLLECTTDSAASDDFICDLTSSNYETATMASGVADFNQSGAAAFFWGNDGLCPPAAESVTVIDQQVNFTNTSSLVSLEQ
jgi:hypothetical protein